MTEPRRRDAARNRDRILAVARQLSDEGGTLQLNDVARQAEVGVATVYRHFPTPEALREAVAAPGLESLIAAGERALAAGDPSRALRQFLTRTVEAQLGDPALSTVAATPVDALEHTTRLKQTLWTVGGQLLDRARRAGVIRPEVRAGDIIPLMCGIAFAANAHDDDPARRTATARRYLNLMLDGLTKAASAT